MDKNKNEKYIMELEELETEFNQAIEKDIVDLDVLDIAFSYGEHRTHIDD